MQIYNSLTRKREEFIPNVAGKVAMYLDLPGYGPEYMEAIGEENLGFTYIPRPDDAKDYNITVEETTAFAIPSTVKNPEVIAKIMYDWTAPKDWRPSAESQHENNFADDFSRKCAGDKLSLISYQKR